MVTREEIEKLNKLRMLSRSADLSAFARVRSGEPIEHGADLSDLMYRVEEIEVHVPSVARLATAEVWKLAKQVNARGRERRARVEQDTDWSNGWPTYRLWLYWCIFLLFARSAISPRLTDLSRLSSVIAYINSDT